jgi:hypothetical protein
VRGSLRTLRARSRGAGVGRPAVVSPPFESEGSGALASSLSNQYAFIFAEFGIELN